MSIIRQDPRYSVLSFIENARHYDHRAIYNSAQVTRVLNQPLGIIPPFQMIKTNGSSWSSIELVRLEDGDSTDIKSLMTLTGLENTEFDGTGGYGDYDIWSYPGTVQLPLSDVSEGVHYLRLMDYDDNYVLSELFTFIDGLELRRDYVKIEWWNLSDFVIDREYVGETITTYAHIKYDAPFKWYIYLNSHVAKHGWQYEVDEQEREGIQFKKSITKYKEFAFRFGAPEHIVDALSFIPQHDKRTVTYDGQTYDKIYDFTFKPEPSGDMYGVLVNFRTNRTTTKLHNIGLTDTDYEVTAGDCLTVQFAAKGIIVDGSAEYTGHYVTNEYGVNLSLEIGDFVMIDFAGNLRLREWTGMAYAIPSYSDYDNIFVEFDDREVGNPLRVDQYFFIVGTTPYEAPYTTSETPGATYLIVGNSFSGSLVQVVLKDSDDNEWVAATVTDTEFKTTGATFSLVDGGRVGTAYKLRAASWKCPVIAEGEYISIEGVDFDEIEDTLIVEGDGDTLPSPEDEGG